MPTIGPVQARLAKSLADLNLTKEENERNLDTASRELVMLEQQERELRKEVDTVEGKREWVEEFRGWVELLGGFLEVKVHLFIAFHHRIITDSRSSRDLRISRQMHFTISKNGQRWSDNEEQQTIPTIYHSSLESRPQ